MSRFLILGLLAPLFIAGCTPDYSPDTYAANAVQQANKVEPGIVVGFRQVEISANGTVGTVSGGAAGGILGSQADVTGVSTALAALGGTVVGGLVGTTIEHAAGDKTGWEYIVRKPNGDLLSVTQREPKPIPVGQKVLVITGNQARIIPDYSVAVEPPPAPPAEHKAGAPAATPAAPAPAAVAPVPAATASSPPPPPAPAAMSTPSSKPEDAAPAAPVPPPASSGSETVPKAPPSPSGTLPADGIDRPGGP